MGEQRAGCDPPPTPNSLMKKPPGAMWGLPRNLLLTTCHPQSPELVAGAPHPVGKCEPCCLGAAVPSEGWPTALQSRRGGPLHQCSSPARPDTGPGGPGPATGAHGPPATGVRPGRPPASPGFPRALLPGSLFPSLTAPHAGMLSSLPPKPQPACGGLAVTPTRTRVSSAGSCGHLCVSLGRI